VALDARTWPSYIIPQPKTNRFPVQIDGADLEIHSEHGVTVGRERIVDKANEKRGFTDTRVAEKEHVKEKIGLALRHERRLSER
jgi:hypothetical protein